MMLKTLPIKHYNESLNETVRDSSLKDKHDTRN